MVDRANAVSLASVGTRLLEHAVAVRHEIGRIGLVPQNAVLLQGIEPLIKDLEVCANGIGGMCALNRVLVQKRDGGLDESQVRAETSMRTLRHRTSRKEARAIFPLARQHGPQRPRRGLHGETRVNAEWVPAIFN